MPPENGQLRAAIYDRVSADKRRDARSVAEQKTANVTACDKHGWQVSEIFTDNDRSASRFARKTRPDWERLGEALAEGRFDVLVLWEPSRGGRELEMWARLLNVCQERGVLIHITSHDRTYDVARARDRRSLAEDGVDSEYESGKISERIRRGTRARAAEGRPHGKRLYGYDRVYNAATGALESQTVNEGEAAVLRDIADMVIQGMSLESIAMRLNSEGVSPPRQGLWRGTQIHRLVLNPSYIGYRTHLGERIHSPEWFPPILSEREHYLVMSRLGDPFNKPGRPTAIKNLLSGLAVCGVCGAAVRSLKSGATRAYTDTRQIPDGRTFGHVSRHQGRVDLYIEALVVARAQRPDALEAMSGSHQASDLREALDEARAERARLEEFYVKAAKGHLSAEGLAKVEAIALPKIEEAERRARGVRFTPHVRELLAGGPEEVPARWRALDVVQQRDIIRGCFEKIEILPVGPGRRKIPDEESVRVTPWRV